MQKLAVIDRCIGTCGSGINGCIWTDYLCSGGSCGSMNYDIDVNKTQCDLCVGLGNYGIGVKQLHHPAAEMMPASINKQRYREQMHQASSMTEQMRAAMREQTALDADTCYANASLLGSIPNRGICIDGIWQGGDAGPVQCTAMSRGKQMEHRRGDRTSRMLRR